MHESCFLCKRFAQLSSLSLHVLLPLPLTVASSFTRRTMEATSAVLWDHFKKIPQDKLQAHIILRFNSYDTDHSGSLDRTEMREAMAEMGRRPSETELDDLMAIADKVNGLLFLLAKCCLQACVVLVCIRCRSIFGKWAAYLMSPSWWPGRRRNNQS